MRAPRFVTRKILRPLRVLRVSVGLPPDPLSPEYLYLVQQSKRIALVQTLNLFRFDNFWSWPVLVACVVLKWLDLGLSNSLIRSLINEYDLLNRIDSRTEDRN
jgi:hypothetical protein